MIKKIALFLFALLPVGLMAQDVKLGHVNSQEIITLMPERADIEKKLNDAQNEIENELVKMREELNAKAKEFVDKQATMPETIKNARQAELASMEQRITQTAQEAQTDLRKQYQDLSSPMIEKVKKAINDAGAEGGFTYIFDLASGAQIIYQSPKAIDITPIVKKKLGLTALKPAAVTKPTETKATETKPAEEKK